MPRVLPFVLLVLSPVTACAPAVNWQKTGADERAMASDLVDCRRTAREEALKSNLGPRVLTVDRSVYFDNSRGFAADRLTDACMRERGYQQISAPAKAPSG